jgi:cell division protein FtsL
MRGPKTNPLSGVLINFFDIGKLRSVLIFGTVISIFLYLFVVNNSAVLGIKISEHQRNIYELQSQNKELQLQITNLQAISRIEKMATQLNMVRVDHYDYIGGDTVVAIK